MGFSDTLNNYPTSWNTLVVRRDRWQHGRFRLPIDAPDFRDTGPIGWPTIVFPREAATITMAGHDPVVADPGTVMVYNANAEYTREAISPNGDRCEWYAVHPADAADIAYALGLARGPDETDATALFGFTHVHCDTALYRDQRHLADRLAAKLEDNTDPISADEAILGIFERALVPGRSSREGRSAANRAPTQRAHRDLAEDTRYLLAARFSEKLTLDTLADDLDCSPFHLARVFRHWTGQTIHRYLTQLRLAAAMDLMESNLPLRNIALRTGFCRHSHFTKAFRDHMGVTPSEWRGATRLSRLEQSKRP